MFVPSLSGKPVCLICGFCVSVTKKYNLERHYTTTHSDTTRPHIQTLYDYTFRHYTTTHSDINAQYPVCSELRKDFIAKKEVSLTSQQSFFTKAKEQNKSAVVASYEVALLLVRRSPMRKK